MRRGDIILLHGAFVGGWVFERLRIELNRHGWRTHAPDLPFHGSEFAGQPPHPDLARQDLALYRASIEAEIGRVTQASGVPPVLLGHSLGGLLAQQLAARGLARAAVLLAPVAPWGVWPHTRFEAESAIGLLLHTGNLSHRSVAPDFGIATAYSMDQVPPALQRDIFARMVPESGRVLFEAMAWWLDWHAASQVPARRVQVPMLVLSGSADRVTPPVTCKAVARRYPGRAVYREVPELGHFVFGEPREADVTAIIAAWLDDHATLPRERP